MVGSDKDESDTWTWVLPYPDLCLCTQVIMGGMNFRTPIRPIQATYVYSPFISNDVYKIREHYNLTCAGKGMRLILLEIVVRNSIKLKRKR